jgi:hypothetical protein
LISNLLDRGRHTENPTTIRSEIAAIFACSYRRAMTFLRNGRNFGQALKTENLGWCAIRWDRLLLPENPYS